jgi:hypothetical protein
LQPFFRDAVFPAKFFLCRQWICLPLNGFHNHLRTAIQALGYCGYSPVFLVFVHSPSLSVHVCQIPGVLLFNLRPELVVSLVQIHQRRLNLAAMVASLIKRFGQQ